MSLLQDPAKALDQIEWFLDNQSQEKFPGAFLKASGNLSRQVLEQILFILAFYSGMPRNKYMKQDFRLKMADQIWKSLKEINPKSGRTYLDDARSKNNRIRKFARLSRSINKWRRDFNELSHFRNPVKAPKTKAKHIREFTRKMRDIIDPLDSFLITAAVNEILSRGKFKAIINIDPSNTPGICRHIIVRPEDIIIEGGKIGLKPEPFSICVVPADQEVSLFRRRNALLLVQHTKGISINTQLITTNGQPVNITNLKTTIESLARTPKGFPRLQRHLTKLGITIERT
jgi:hypothetical protein